MDGNMKNLLDTLNTLREIKWEIIAQAQELDQELETVAEMTTAVITSLYENYGQAWLEFDGEGRRGQKETIHFPLVLLESRRFEVTPKPAA